MSYSNKREIRSDFVAHAEWQVGLKLIEAFDTKGLALAPEYKAPTPALNFGKVTITKPKSIFARILGM